MNLNLSKIFQNLGKFLLFVIFSLVCFQYFMSRHYKYPGRSPFTGKFIYNPYACLRSYWWKSNFHAHSIAWRFANGHQYPRQIVSHFKKDLKYDIVCISNYEKRTLYMPPASPKYIPVYEHGYNIDKVHQLVFGLGPIDYFDVCLFQTMDNEQYIIDREKNRSTLVALAHPGLRDAYSENEMKSLTGYDLIEVLSQEKFATRQWDEALSSGKAPWIIADDDCHDISRKDQTGISWTMVNADTNNAADVLNSLRSGKTYGVSGTGGINNCHLEGVSVSGNKITISVDSVAKQIRLIGQNGTVRKIIENSARACYSFRPDDTYIRAEIDFSSMRIFLNPLIRYDGKTIPGNPLTATCASITTILIRTLIMLFWATAVAVLYFPKFLKGYVVGKWRYTEYKPGLA
jgi:hypothetical protein